jgi:SAM-dependent methyltransferase
MADAIRKLLAHPLVRDLHLHDPRITERRRAIIQDNGFLRRIYDEWYRMAAACIPEGPGRVLEVGSGAGFLADYIPGLISSEVFLCPGIDLVFDARRLPFASAALKAIAMVDVFHHIPDSRIFLREAQRCLRPGGSMVMIEPWVSAWSRAVYTRFHHEPFDPAAQEWTFPDTGPLSGANNALPWIVFERDRRQFEAEFPELEIQAVRPIMAFRYLVSGGVSLRQLMPAASFGLWRSLESALFSAPARWPMFVFIHVRRR